MMQQDKPDDYVLSTGKKISVRDFTTMAFSHLGIDLKWIGDGINEKAINSETGDIIVEVDEKYFRPTEVDLLIGDSTKAREKLGWIPKYSVEDLCKEMVEFDYRELIKNKQFA